MKLMCGSSYVSDAEVTPSFASYSIVRDVVIYPKISTTSGLNSFFCATRYPDFYVTKNTTMLTLNCSIYVQLVTWTQLNYSDFSVVLKNVMASPPTARTTDPLRKIQVITCRSESVIGG
jgi:hypothetical protein